MVTGSGCKVRTSGPWFHDTFRGIKWIHHFHGRSETTTLRRYHTIPLPVCAIRRDYAQLGSTETRAAGLNRAAKGVERGDDRTHVFVFVEVWHAEHGGLWYTKRAGGIHEICDVLHLLEWGIHGVDLL